MLDNRARSDASDDAVRPALGFFEVLDADFAGAADNKALAGSTSTCETNSPLWHITFAVCFFRLEDTSSIAPSSASYNIPVPTFSAMARYNAPATDKRHIGDRASLLMNIFGGTLGYTLALAAPGTELG